MIADFWTWWYGTGWQNAAKAIPRRADGTLDAFSVGLLLRTLFAPFRQIDAGGVRGPIGVQFQAWLSRQFSRFFGAGLRSLMIMIGLTGALLTWVIGIVWILLWPLLPLTPIVGLLLWATGVTL